MIYKKNCKKYIHDCCFCTYLGSLEHNYVQTTNAIQFNYKYYDVYICEKEPNSLKIIVRYGDHESSYEFYRLDYYCFILMGIGKESQCHEIEKHEYIYKYVNKYIHDKLKLSEF